MIVIFTPNGSSCEVNYQGETFTKGDDTAHTIYAIVSDDSINSTNFQGFITFRREDLELSEKMPMAYGYVDYAGMKYKCFKFEMQGDWYTAVAGTLATTIEIRQYLQTGAIRNKAFGTINIPIQDSVVKDFDTSITKEEYNAMMKLIESLIVEANPRTTGNEDALLSLRVHNENFEIKRTLFNFSEVVSEATAKVLRQITIDGDAWKIPEFKIDLSVNGTSLNAVANKAVYDFVNAQIEKVKTKFTPDGTMSDTSANAVQNKVIKSYIDNLIKSTDTSLRTNINLVRQDLTSYANNVEKICKAYTDGKITKSNLISVIGEATSSMSGLMSPVDKASLDVLKAMIAQDDNNIVDKLQEVLDIFAKYPEGTDLFTLLSEKANKKDVYTKDEVDVLKEDVESKITLDYSTTPLVEGDKVQKNMVLNPIVNGKKDENVELYPITKVGNLITDDGEKFEEVELELSDSEPSATAKELKKVLMNGTEWKIVGGEEVLKVDLGVLMSGESVFVDDATNQKILNKKITKIRGVASDNGMITNVDFYLFEHVSMPDIGENMLVFMALDMGLAVESIGGMLFMYDANTKEFTNFQSASFVIAGRIYGKTADGQKIVIGNSEVEYGSLVTYINIDYETISNKSNYFPSSKAVMAYVDGKVEEIKTAVEESVTTALSDDYTIGG